MTSLAGSTLSHQRRGANPGCPGPSTRDRLRGLVTEILAMRTPISSFSDNDTLAELGIASIDMVTLLFSIENEFGVEVPQYEITADVFRSISTIDALIQRLRPETVVA